MKYRIKLPEGVPSVYIGKDCIVELEPIEEVKRIQEGTYTYTFKDGWVKQED